MLGRQYACTNKSLVWSKKTGPMSSISAYRQNDGMIVVEFVDHILYRREEMSDSEFRDFRHHHE